MKYYGTGPIGSQVIEAGQRSVTQAWKLVYSIQTQNIYSLLKNQKKCVFSENE